LELNAESVVAGHDVAKDEIGIGAAGHQDAVAGVAEIRGARDVGADVVALNDAVGAAVDPNALAAKAIDD
jgi:hypothetical protein